MDIKTSSTVKKFLFKSKNLLEDDVNNLLLAERIEDDKYYDINNKEYNKNEITIIREITKEDIENSDTVDITIARLNAVFIMLYGTNRFYIQYSNENYKFNFHYPSIDMENGEGDSNEMLDMYVEFNSENNLGCLFGRRTTFKQSELECGYISSHQSSGWYDSKGDFCLGESPLSSILAMVDDNVAILGQFEISENDLTYWYTLPNFLHSYLSWENSDDVYIQMDSINPCPINEGNNDFFKDIEVEGYNLGDITESGGWYHLIDSMYSYNVDETLNCRDFISQYNCKNDNVLDFNRIEVFKLLTATNLTRYRKLLYNKYYPYVEKYIRELLSDMLEKIFDIDNNVIIKLKDTVDEEDSCNIDFLIRLFNDDFKLTVDDKILRFRTNHNNEGSANRIDRIERHINELDNSLIDNPLVFKGITINKSVIEDVYSTGNVKVVSDIDRFEVMTKLYKSLNSGKYAIDETELLKTLDIVTTRDNTLDLTKNKMISKILINKNK